MHSNKAVKHKLQTKHSLTTVKLNYSVFIKRDKRFWNVTMHIKLGERQIPQNRLTIYNVITTGTMDRIHL